MFGSSEPSPSPSWSRSNPAASPSPSSPSPASPSAQALTSTISFLADSENAVVCRCSCCCRRVKTHARWSFVGDDDGDDAGSSSSSWNNSGSGSGQQSLPLLALSQSPGPANGKWNRRYAALGCWGGRWVLGAGFWNQLPANCRARCKVPGASCKRNVSPKMEVLPGLVKVPKSWRVESRVRRNEMLVGESSSTRHRRKTARGILSRAASCLRCQLEVVSHTHRPRVSGACCQIKFRPSCCFVDKEAA